MCSHHQYDEDLKSNIFYEKLQSQYGDLAEKASNEGWVLCVPRSGTLKSDEITTDLVLDHVLIPSYHQKDQFLTLSKKTIDLDGKNRELSADGLLFKSNPVRILFEETFYTGKSKLLVWCLEKPLFSKKLTCCDPQLTHPEHFQDCLDFLWTIKNFGSFLQEEIHRICEEFVEKQYDFELRDLNTQTQLVFKIYQDILDLPSTEINNNQDVFRLAVETYTQNYLSHILIKAVNTYTCHEDAYLNKLIRNCCDLQLKHFDIGRRFYNSIGKAKSKLGTINDFVTILDKFNCLKSTFNLLFNAGANASTDDILQIFVFLIIKLPIYNWHSNLAFLCNFTNKKSQEFSYYLTTLEAALEFIKSDEFAKLKYRPLEDYLKMDQNLIFNSIISAPVDNLNLLFQNHDDNKLLCHPLCDCPKCLNKNQSFDNVNEKGQNLLIFATILSNTEIVEFLISKNCDLNSRDFNGRTALHYSCLSGNQKLLLILINGKADINRKDNDGNTPLMLAVNCGHTNCVKALIYTCNKNLDLNNGNSLEDTALHFALKWGFIEIVKILLENSADVNLSNKKNEYPVDLARNYYTFRLLQQMRGSDLVNPKLLLNKIHNFKNNHQKHKCTEHGIKPRNEDEYRKVELLLKSIEDNDLPLTCFHLGFLNESDKSQDEAETIKCHPLCNCDKCSIGDDSIKKTVKNLKNQSINVNICNGDGYTPLHLAVKFGRTEILRILLDSRANPNIKSYKTLHTPLHLACIFQRLSIVKELVKCGGCDLNSRDYNGNPAIFYSCLKNDSKSVEILLLNGADASLKNFQGESAFTKARDKRLFAISKIIKEWTNHVDHSDSDLF